MKKECEECWGRVKQTGHRPNCEGCGLFERGELLDKAKKTINGERQDSYGNPEDSFKRIANFWNAYLANRPKQELSPKDVAHMMVLMKMARIQNDTEQEDSYVDLLGYAALASEM